MSEATASPSWQARITGRWALSWQSYALGVVVNVPLMVLTGGRIGTRIVPAADMVVLAAYGVGASLLVGAWALLMNATLMRGRRSRPVALWRFVLLHAVSGAIFGSAIVLADARLGISLGVPWPLTVGLTVGLGLWWGVTTAMLFEARERFLVQRAVLLDEAVLGQLASMEDSRVAVALADEARMARDEVNEHLSRARDELTARITQSRALGEWLATAELMRSTADQTVRPLSHALWQEAAQRYPEPRVSGVMSQLLREPSFLPLPAASVILIGYVGATTLAYGPWLGLAVAIALGVLAYGVLRIGNLVMRRWASARAAVYFGTVCVLQAATLTLAYGPAQAEGETVPASLVAGSILGTLISVLLTSVVASLDESRSSVMRQLRSTVNAERLAQAASSRTRSEALRELARDLHGTVQTRLIACASAIELASREGDVAACLDALRESVRILDGLRQEPGSTVGAQLEALARAWTPMCVIDLRLDPDVAALQHADTVRVVEEAIGNAYRHGGAQRIVVAVRLASDDVQVEVLDDGSGPRGGPPGLGSDMLTRVSRGRFDLRAVPDGGAILTAALPTDG